MPEGSDPGPGRGGLVLKSRPMPILESVEEVVCLALFSGGLSPRWRLQTRRIRDARFRRLQAAVSPESHRQSDRFGTG